MTIETVPAAAPAAATRLSGEPPVMPAPLAAVAPPAAVAPLAAVAPPAAARQPMRAAPRRQLALLARRVERVARGMGIGLFPMRRMHAWIEHEHLGRLLDFLEVDCVFDIGANRGQFARGLREGVGYRGAIVSYEPNPALLPALSAAAAGDPLWQVVPAAVGRAAGTAELNVTASDWFSSLLAPGESPLAAMEGENHVTRRVSVPVVTLADELLRVRATLPCRKPFLKMDTQGFDLEVVRGAGAAIEAFVGLKSELAIVPLYEGAPDHQVALAAYRAAGFELSAFVPNNAGHFPRLIEIDCHMVRRDLLPGTAAAAGP